MSNIVKPKQTEAERLQMLVDIAKEGQEVAKIMKDYADKNPMSRVLKELDKPAAQPREAQMVKVTQEMIDAAESVEDLYRRGTPETWAKVYRVMSAVAPAQPDCRTCDYFVKFEGCTRNSKFGVCTNGDKYEAARKVVLWRTEP